MPVHLLWGMTADGAAPGPGSSYLPTSDFRPRVESVKQVPITDPSELEPGMSASGEEGIEMYSDGENVASILTNDLRPRIITEEDEED